MQQASKNTSSNFRKIFFNFNVPLHLQHKREDVLEEDSCNKCLVQTDCSKCIQKAPDELKAKFIRVGV